MYIDTPEGYEHYQRAHNDYDMLKGAVYRMFITDDKEELSRLYEGAKYYLDRVYDYGQTRMEWLIQQTDS